MLKEQLLKIYVFVVLLAGERVLADSVEGYEYVSDVGGWLRLHAVPTSWRDARLQCLLEGGTPVSPTNNALAEAMKAMMVKHQVTSIAVFTDSNTTVKSVDGGPLLNSINGESNNLETCSVMNAEGTVAEDNCASLYPYICYKEQAIKCTTDPGYKFEPRTGSFYKFHTDRRTWFGAAVACSAEGAHLAVINSDTESVVLKELTSKYLYTNVVVFIGIWNLETHGVWKTIFDETLAEAGFSTWSPTQPDNWLGKEHCGTIHANGLYNDYGCNERMTFICEINPKINH